MAILIRKYEEKPYHACLNCTHIGQNCDGPNFLAMDMPRLAEWCRLRKDYLHNIDPKWTNAHIAEQAGLSKVSVDRFLSGNAGDLKTSTVSGVLRVLVDGSWGQYPCAMDAWANTDIRDLTEKLTAAKTKNRFLEDSLEAMKKEYQLDTAMLRGQANDQITQLKKSVEFYEGQLEAKDRQIAEKDKQLGERAAFMRRKDAAIRVLSFLLLVFILLILTAIFADLLYSDRGFFWLDRITGFITRETEPFWRLLI